MVVISPHLDDAAFGCGQALAAHPGSTVVSVFAGIPANGCQRTPWDERCGFGDAESAMRARRDEDRQALAMLRARPVWLDFSDSQYGQPAPARQIGLELARVLRELEAGLVLFPLGLFHSDHLRVHEAAAAALCSLPGVTALAYEDALYRGLPGLLQQRLAELAGLGVRATPAALPCEGRLHEKRLAVHAYASQLRAFGPGGHDDLWRPERFWKLEGGALSFLSCPYGGPHGERPAGQHRPADPQPRA